MAFDLEKLNRTAAGIIFMHTEEFTFNSKTYDGSPTVVNSERMVNLYGHDATLSGSFYLKYDDVDFNVDDFTTNQEEVTWRGEVHRIVGTQWDATRSSLRIDLTQDEG